MEVEVEDSESKAQEVTDSITSKCRETVKQHINLNKISPSDAVDAFISCAKPLVTHEIEESNLPCSCFHDLKKRGKLYTYIYIAQEMVIVQISFTTILIYWGQKI